MPPYKCLRSPRAISESSSNFFDHALPFEPKGCRCSHSSAVKSSRFHIFTVTRCPLTQEGLLRWSIGVIEQYLVRLVVAGHALLAMVIHVQQEHSLEMLQTYDRAVRATAGNLSENPELAKTK